MGRLQAIARSIVRAVIKDVKKRSSSPIAFIISLLSTIFSFYELPLHKHRPKVFSELCQKYWNIDDEEYAASFRAEEGAKPEEALMTMGDLGFSGSTFFATSDGKYLVKSVSRNHEHTFFRDDLLDPYSAHMSAHPTSLLVRITDFLASSGLAVGHRLSLAPSHHIIMENIMYGKAEAEEAGNPVWEQWDLKPTSYFYPERDIAEGRLTSEATKSQLADEFHDKLLLSKDQADDFWRSLEEDTRLLAHYNAVDYSLFLVRIPTEAPTHDINDPSSSSAQHRGVSPPSPPSWRTGIPSADGKYVYRAAILDFFWAKHKVQPQLMTFLINSYNKVIHHHGPMSITTTPDEYKERFLKLCHDIVEIRKDAAA